MSDNRFMMLQFFADGASGGDGGEGAASTGDNAADAGRDLEALGVPREYAERHKQRMEKKRGKAATAQDAPVETAKPSQPSQEAEAQAANDGGSNEWDAFFSKQENKDKLQQMMAERGKAATEAKNAANAQMEKLSPMLRILGEKYGIKPGDDGSFDLDAINEAVTKDDSYFEDKALEMGVSVDVARKLEQADMLEQQQKQAEEKAKRAAFLQEHFNHVQEQANTLRQKFPDFDLNAELQNPEFVRRTAPGAMSVEDAYFSLHHNEIMQRQAESIARRAKEKASAAVQSGSARPRENGGAAMATVSTAPNPKSMGREAYKQYIQRKYSRKNVYG